MDQKQGVESISSAVKSSLDPSTTNVIETPEPQPEEHSDDFEVDPADPETIDPELINTPGLNPEEEEHETETAVDPALDPEISDPSNPDVDLPVQDEVIREEIESGVRDRNGISNPDAGI